METKYSYKAIGVGGLVDFVTTNLLMAGFIVYASAELGLKEVGPDQFQMISGSFSLLMTQWMIGASGAMLGGYVAARMAGRDEIRHAALSSFLSIGAGIVILLTSASGVPVTHQVAGILASPLFSSLGGFLKSVKPRRKRAGA